MALMSKINTQPAISITGPHATKAQEEAAALGISPAAFIAAAVAALVDGIAASPEIGEAIAAQATESTT
jgi:hypothetical protein